MNQHCLFALGVAALLTACNQQASKEQAPTSANAAADAPAQPASAGQSAEQRVRYPGSQAGDGPDRFVTSDPIDRVVAWYWDAERPLRERDGKTWAVDKPERRDDGYLIGVTLVGDEDGNRFAIYLNPRAGGGTEGRVRAITDEEVKSGVKL